MTAVCKLNPCLVYHEAEGCAYSSSPCRAEPCLASALHASCLLCNYCIVGHLHVGF